ncbi:carboxylesterase/lipase family protein [Ruania rhizosphaerae]|uniref:carboxylesterase/lipase family protein n=1 Tax=Ruania rhizosphaerae TaxID=1840413 RepID=UPI00135B6E68|nr:carboxylesterase family protein [Ruania rhizosphaerae]
MRTKLAAGDVEGAVRDTEDGKVLALLGVPYGAPEGDGLRFRRAHLHEGWAGTRSAMSPGAVSPQDPARVGSARVSEVGALNLNVWRPVGASGPLPVLVWIHGGAHMYGSNAHPLCDGGRLAAAHDMIVVAPNYRLGALGHLRLDHLLGDDFADAGNLALHDVMLALSWIHANATALGADDQRVTIMGQSSGGAVVDALLSTETAGSLFRGVIAQSSLAERVHLPQEAADATAQLLDELRLNDRDAGALLALPAEEIIAAQVAITHRRRTERRLPWILFQPMVDGRLLPSIPLRAIAEGAGSEVDLLAGTNLNEGSGEVDLRSTDEHLAGRELERLLQERYPGTEAGTYKAAMGGAASDVVALESLYSDLLYRQPTNRLLSARRAASGAGRTYSYLFRWSRPDTDAWARRAGHSLELPFIFRHVDDSEAAAAEVGSNPPLTLMHSMSKAWAGFVHEGRPTLPRGRPWPEYGEARRTAVLDEEIVTTEDPLAGLRILAEEHELAPVAT